MRAHELHGLMTKRAIIGKAIDTDKDRNGVEKCTYLRGVDASGMDHG